MAFAHITEPLGGALINLDRAAAKRAGQPVIETIAEVGGWEAPAPGSERYRMLDAALAARGSAYRSEGGRMVFGAWAMVRAAAVFATERDLIEVQQTGWGLTANEARLALTQWGLNEIRPRHAEPGDLLLFDMPDADLGAGRTQPGGIHAAILSAPGGELSWAMLPRRKIAEPRIIHVQPARACCESWAGPFWMPKLVGAWSYDTGNKARPFRLEVAA